MGHKKRVVQARLALKSHISLENHILECKNKKRKARRAQWSHEALKMAIEGLDQGYKIAKVNNKYGISRSSLGDHNEGKTSQKKIGPKIVLPKNKKDKLVKYIELLVQ